MNRSIPFLTVMYALLVIILGIMGYRQAGSTISLLAGVGLGVLLLISIYFMYQRKAWSYILAAAITLILLIAFGIRFGKTLAFMPAAMAFLSLVVMMSLISQSSKIIRR